MYYQDQANQTQQDGKHLHFEVQILNSNGKAVAVNPEPYLP